MGGGGSIAIEKPQSNVYFDLEGTIWMQEQGGYQDYQQQTGAALYIDSPPSQQGGYFNRV